MKVCMICLRGDKKIKTIDTSLVELHDEICDFSLPPALDLSYCMECEYLLKKHFKFRKQCVKAIKIYLTWKKRKATNRPPIHTLAPLLGAPTLDIWQPSSHVANVTLTPESEHLTWIDVFSIKSEVTNDKAIRNETKRKEKKDNVVPIKEKNARKQKECEIQEIKTEKDDDDPTDSMTISDFIQSTHEVDIYDSNKTVKHEENNDNNKSIQVLSLDNEDVLGDDGAISNDYDDLKISDDGEQFDKDEKNDDQIEQLDKDVKLGYQIEQSENDREKVAEEEIIDEDFLKSLEGMDFEHVYSDDDDDYGSDSRTKSKKGVESSLKHFKRSMPVNIDLLKLELIKRLSSCDEILAKDGTPINKEMIINNLHDKVSYHDLRSLRSALKSKPKSLMTSKLKETLNSLHESFKEDEKFQTVFDIQYLTTYELKLEEFEKRKTYESYINAEHKCDICYTPFRRAKDLENHTKEHHDVTAENAGECCPICKVRPGPRQYKRNAHAYTHSAVYKCKLCTLITYYRGTMRNHYGMHVGKMYKCDHCEYTFKWQSAYFLHMSKYHLRKQHICTTCGRGFPTAHALTTHSRTHQNEPAAEGSGAAVPCAMCGVQFPSQEVLEVHMADVHTQRRPANRFAPSDTRDLPSYRTNANAYKWRKPRAQAVIRPVKCKLCNTVRLGAAWLKTHFKREHPTEDWNMQYAGVQKHLCDICGSGFASVYSLRDHMNLHTGARPFACDLCPKRFRSAVLMRDHRARHFPPTNLCTLCGKKFKTKSNLFNHMKVHSGEKTHKCEICGKSFQYSATLNEHVRGVHHNIRRVRRRAPAEKERVQEMDVEHLHREQAEGVAIHNSDS